MLVEREHEIRLLETAFEECVRGHGRIALASGAVASGKTELLRFFTDRCQAGKGLVLTATAARSETDEPHGVLRQLLDCLPSDEGATEGLNPEQVERESDRQTTGALLELSQRVPVVIAVDDVHLADRPSLAWLLSLANRIRSERVMLVLAESSYDWAGYPNCRIELIRQTHFCRLRLAPLTVGGVVEVLSRHLGPETAREIAGGVHQISGGNQLLVRALVEDYLDSLSRSGGDWQVGESYRQAVLTCLHRSGPEVLEAARAMAVLGDSGSVSRVAELLDWDTHAVTRALQGLNTATLLVDGRFRHPEIQAAVYHDLEPSGLTELHTRAARLMSRDGEPGAAADHLLSARTVSADWAVTELFRAAEEALAGDEERAAVRYLEFALSLSTDPTEQAALRLRLARAEQRYDPEAVNRHWVALMDAHRDGLLDAAQVGTLLRMGMRQGRVRDGIELIDHLAGLEPPRDEYTETVLTSTEHWLRSTFPRFLPPGTEFTARQSGRPAVRLPGHRSQAVVLLSTLFTEGPHEREQYDTVAEQVLQDTLLGEDTLEAVVCALQALTLDDQLPVAARWCDHLLAEAERRGVLQWQSILAAARADIALRAGELPESERYAARALSLGGGDGLGVVAGAPLSLRLRAATAMGDLDSARAHLRTPVPEGTYQSRYGLQLLQARGHFHLATEQPRAALEDFRYCGELMTEWGIDTPSFIDWRNDLAQAHLRLGDHQAARHHAEEQLALEGPRRTRAYGVALRVLAGTRDEADRLPMLQEAVEVLQARGARLPLASALEDLSQAHQNAGDTGRARVISYRAARLARECGVQQRPSPQAVRAEVPVVLLASHSGRWTPTPPAPTRDQPVEALTLSERRVAALASMGYTNREISAKLLITVSTVEQHLTKVFRKLKVKNRTDLAVEWVPESPDTSRVDCSSTPQAH
ncbi:AAA family ATPase [Streptomyces sp. NPDC005438]|uniref:helix-turn-helix transcriptional regulator n=1 Tax=Streptomyces sp. NPDC005438 TaxID=3156880 RepID=UPI0033AC7D81